LRGQTNRLTKWESRGLKRGIDRTHENAEKGEKLREADITYLLGTQKNDGILKRSWKGNRTKKNKQGLTDKGK